MEMGSACLSAALCAAACVGWDEAEAIPAPEKQHHKNTISRDRDKKSLLNPLHLHKPLLYVVYWILQARGLLGAACRAHS